MSEDLSVTVVSTVNAVKISSSGPQGPPGPPGPSGGASFTFNFVVPATQWLITHNLSRYPEPVVFLTGDTHPVEADINYLSDDAFTVTFSALQTGRVEI